jgi:uncharacterized membrane protein YccC
MRNRLGIKRPQDPGFAALRRAARAALVIPLAFAFGSLVLQLGQNVIFVVFGCFALLIISDFGGKRPARALAYIAATLVAGLLVVVGTAASENGALAVAAVFVVAFIVSFARVFGGYVAAGQTGMLLAFVVAVSIPAPASAIPGRLSGLLIAGIISTVAAVALWPRFEHTALHKKAANACLVVAELVERVDAGQADPERRRLLGGAREAEGAARGQYAATAKRPAGPSRRDRAFVQLLTEVQRIVDVVERPFQQSESAMRPAISEHDDLKASVVSALRASAAVLTGGAPPDVHTVDRARLEHRAALDRWAAQELRSGRAAEQVLDGLDVDHTLRVIAYLTIALGSNAIIASGGRAEPSDLPSIPRPEESQSPSSRIVATIRTHLDPSSTVLHGSLRVAVGLAIAVLIAHNLGLQRGFWVVLGTLQVLRSNALGTGRTAVEALAGTLVGVAIGGAFALLTGANPVVLAVSLPFAFFVAAYAATAVGFAASQAAFSVLLIILFNLITPTGWKVGLVRFEDVLVGVVISVVVGLLLWPHGLRRDLGRAMSRFYRAAGLYLDHAYDQMLGLKPAVGDDSARAAAALARERAGEAFDAFVNEKAPSPLEPEQAGYLLAAANQVMLAADLVQGLARIGYRAGGCAQGADAVGGQVHIVVETLNDYADRLALDSAPSSEAEVSPDRLRAAAVDCLSRWRHDDQIGRGAIAVVMASEWVRNLGRLESDLEPAVVEAVEAARLPWWR